jgi:plastocyanin
VPHASSRLLVVTLLLLGALAAPAAAEVQHLDYRVGPIEVSGYQVLQRELQFDIPKPDVDGSITAMDVDLVDADGTPIPIKRLMLHHIVFTNLGATIGSKRDATCETFTGLDSVSQIPGWAERFYAAGEERAKIAMPQGYGYKVGGTDRWGMTYMVMNHRLKTDRAFIRYRITYDTDPALTPVKPVWMDVRDCKADPVYDVPGGGAPGSKDVQTTDWTAPEAGRVVAANGHVHGGGLALRLSEPDCGDRTLASSTPTWGSPSHPFYNVKPVLHEPGPVNMRGFLSGEGLPIGAGQRLRLSSIYDAERPHTRVMGIMIAFVAPPAPGAEAPPCAPLGKVVPDVEPAGRKSPPKVTVPLTGLDRRGRAREISAPPGRLVRTKKNKTRVRVKDYAFSRPNLSVPRGATVKWTFDSKELHDVTLASGPRGFSSPHHYKGAVYSKKLTKPGTYRLFCSLHPVAMSERIIVRK